jgi:hypothetical protein
MVTESKANHFFRIIIKAEVRRRGLTYEATNQTDKLKACIIDAVHKFQPENVEQLIGIIQKQTLVSNKEITNSLVQLETENKLFFAEKNQTFDIPVSKSWTLKKMTWFWTTLTLLSLSILIFSLSTLNLNWAYLIFLRYIFAIILVLFLPGFAFIKLLFGSKMPFSGDIKTDYIEIIGVSVGLSIILVPMVGLGLNYTSWGIGFESLIVSLIVLTLLFASGAALREYAHNNT